METSLAGALADQHSSGINNLSGINRMRDRPALRMLLNWGVFTGFQAQL
jgi:hypothetical protein